MAESSRVLRYVLDKAYMALEICWENMIIKDNSGQGSERKKESCGESYRENEYHHEQNADRNMDV